MWSFLHYNYRFSNISLSFLLCLELLKSSEWIVLWLFIDGIVNDGFCFKIDFHLHWNKTIFFGYYLLSTYFFYNFTMAGKQYAFGKILYFKFWILIFSRAINIWYDTLLLCWALTVSPRSQSAMQSKGQTTSIFITILYS